MVKYQQYLQKILANQRSNFWKGFLICITIILVGCNNTTYDNAIPNNKADKTTDNNLKIEAKVNENNSDVNYFVSELNNKENSSFFIGMTLEDFKNQLSITGIGQLDEIEITDSIDSWDFGHKQFYSDNITFTFDENFKLYDIYVSDDIPTSLGLTFSDTKEDMVKIYGSEYVEYNLDEYILYEFNMESYYFYVLSIENHINGWGISYYSYEKSQ